MSVFGIQALSIDHSKPDTFFVGEDEILWRWVFTDNYDPASGGCEVPEGYLVHEGNVFPAEQLTDTADTQRVLRIASIRMSGVEKMYSLLGILREVSEDEFRALNLPPNRIAPAVIP